MKGWRRFALLAATLALTACASKMTEANLHRVHNGMAPDEVRAVLGSPSSVDTKSVLGIPYTTYLYHTDKSDVTVQFLNDHVVALEGDFSE